MGKRVSFRVLHLWEFRNGRIARENVWLDGNAVPHNSLPKAGTEPQVNRRFSSTLCSLGQ
jgi:hypothetical protein